MRNCKFKDIATFSYGKMPNKNLILTSGTYPVFSGYQISGYYDNYNAEANELVLIARGVGGTGEIRKTPARCWLTNLSIKIDVYDSNVLKDYLFYMFQANDLRWLNSGSAQPQITINDLSELDLSIQNLKTQRHIVDILGTLDEKIENLEATNSKLQAYCMAEHQLYFSHIRKVPLSTIATITMGQSPAGNTLNNNEGTIFYQGRTDFGFRYPTVRLFTTEPKRMAKASDILLSVRAPVGDVNIAFEDCCIGRGIAAISSQYSSFVYYSILNQKSDFDIYNNSGTIFGSINRDALSSFQVPASNINLIIEFENKVTLLDDKIYTNTLEIAKLRTLKQAYLKKFFG